MDEVLQQNNVEALLDRWPKLNSMYKAGASSVADPTICSVMVHLEVVKEGTELKGDAELLNIAAGLMAAEGTAKRKTSSEAEPLSWFHRLVPIRSKFQHRTPKTGRAPHGLAYENPLVLSPSAIEFFHPKSSKSNAANGPSLFSSSDAVAESTLAHESRLSTSNSTTSGSRVGVGGVIGIVFGFVLAVLLAMGVYYVVITRQTNATRAKSVQPDV
ncbi:hypothetical protein FRX31_031489 [Thalictrum thalictroides]|uniref:Transmembrane protein n=1 Tax=Thalictrum thalictroides TaxID=46969 RepID=A0A7J6V1P9_THATH|nr:hypothetical protein FRX31_031489 [Thalictrum thalictroides]